MGNANLADGEILRLLEEGWKFRVKTVKGKRYITRRKGQTERSVGPYDEELWKVISNSRGKSSDGFEAKTNLRDTGISAKEREVTRFRSKKAEEKFELYKKMEKMISLHKTVSMMTRCIHNDRGYCNYWTWDTRPKFLDIIDKLDGADSGLYSRIKEGVKANSWILRAYVALCENCPSYISSSDIQNIANLVKKELDKSSEPF